MPIVSNNINKYIKENFYSIAIIGSRNFFNYHFAEKKILEILEKDNINNIKNIISGGAEGADKIAEKFASRHNIPITIFKPDWKKLGRKAGPIRNTKIIENSDIIIAFWDGKSTGTYDSIKKSQK